MTVTQGGEGTVTGRRPVDPAHGDARLQLPAGLHAAVATRLGPRDSLQRPRGRRLRAGDAGPGLIPLSSPFILFSKE